MAIIERLKQASEVRGCSKDDQDMEDLMGASTNIVSSGKPLLRYASLFDHIIFRTYSAKYTVEAYRINTSPKNV